MSEPTNQPVEPDSIIAIRIQKKVAEIVDLTIRGIPPFDGLQKYLPLNCNKEVLLNYTEEEKQELVESYIAFNKFSVGGESFRNEVAWRKVKQLGDELTPILRSRYIPVSSEKRYELEKFPTKDRIKLVDPRIKKRFPDFRLDKNVKMGIGEGRKINAIIGTLIYSKPVLGNNRLLMSFDLGNGKTNGMFESYIGIEKPLYTVRATNFFAGRYAYCYYTPDELVALMDECLDLLEILVPVFEQKIVDALLNK
jgi:hypothetical protein